VNLNFKIIALDQGKAFQYGYEIGYFVGQNWILLLILSIIFIFLFVFFILSRKKKEGTEQ